MQPPADVRAQVLALRKLLKEQTSRQEFNSLEEFLMDIDRLGRKHKDADPEEALPDATQQFERDPKLSRPAASTAARYGLEAMARVFAGLYVHLPFKRTRYAANPVESLKALGRNLPMPVADFNRSLFGIFRELHDPHTTYTLPEPYKSSEAFLPFLVAAGYDAQAANGWSPDPIFYVTHVARKLAAKLKESGFEPMARITHWNGMPMDMVIHRLALDENGANPHACFARAMNSLTIRALSKLLPPDAPTVTIRYDPPPGATTPPGSELIFDWSVRRAAERDSLRRLLFRLPSPKEEGWHAWDLLPIEKVAYRFIDFEHPTAADNVKVGVIRVRSFREEVESFVNGFRELIEEMQREAPLALILDVRRNSGGNISAGERLLQLFTPGHITPVSFQFLNSPLLHEIVKQNPEEAARRGRFGLDVDTGAVYSRAGHLTAEAEANDVGQRYYGRVALIVDALCYSATDIFAAGFQDHRIGPVIGVDGSTGGGGANVWSYESDIGGKKTEDGFHFPPLPDGADMQFSVRQCLRTGRFQGNVLEDFGVTPDYRYFLTEKDLFESDKSLYEFAFSKLLWGAGLKEVSLDVQVTKLDRFDEQIQVDFQTAGVVRCEVLLNNQTLSVGDVPDAGWRSSSLAVLTSWMKQLEVVELRCYNTLRFMDFPFYTEQEREAMGDEGKKNMLHPVAARKFFTIANPIRQLPKPEFPRKYPPIAERRRHILYFVAGAGRRNALESLAIRNELKSVFPDAKIRFVSHGTGAKILREHRVPVIDLDLPDRPPLFAVQNSFAELLKTPLDMFSPLLIVSHGEFDLGRRSRAFQGDMDLPCPCVLITNRIPRDPVYRGMPIDAWYREAIASHRETLVLGEAAFDPESNIRPVGPILRPLRYSREDLALARRELGLSEKELVISIIVDPGDRTELAAPVYDIVTKAFELIDPSEYTRGDLRLRGKRLLWDPAARVRDKSTFDASDYGRVMCASDVVIVKEDADIIDELLIIGKPFVEISHSSLYTNSILNRSFERDGWIPYTFADAKTLLGVIDGLLKARNMPPQKLPPGLQHGARNAANRLREILLEIESFGPQRIAEEVQELSAGTKSVAEFRLWFDQHTNWTGHTELTKKVRNILNRQTQGDHLTGAQAAALAEAIRQFDSP